MGGAASRDNNESDVANKIELTSQVPIRGTTNNKMPIQSKSNGARAIRRAMTGKGGGLLSAMINDNNVAGGAAVRGLSLCGGTPFAHALVGTETKEDMLARVEEEAAVSRARIAANPPKIKKGKKNRKPKK